METQRLITVADWDRLAAKLRTILGSTFVVEFRRKHQMNENTTTDELMKIVRSEPWLFYYVNRQVTEVMAAFRKTLEEISGVKIGEEKHDGLQLDNQSGEENPPAETSARSDRAVVCEAGGTDVPLPAVSARRGQDD